MMDTWHWDIDILKIMQIRIERYLKKEQDIVALFYGLWNLVDRLLFIDEEWRAFYRGTALTLEIIFAQAADRYQRQNKEDDSFLTEKEESEVCGYLAELAEMIRRKLRELEAKEAQALRQTDSAINNWAQDLSLNWLMCPLCEEAWENGSKTLMVRCPKCHQRLHNPQFKETQIKEIKLAKEELSLLSCVVGTVWCVWRAPDMEKTLDASINAINQLYVKLNKIEQKQTEGTVTFYLTKFEALLLSKIVDYAVEEGEGEFSTLIGVEPIEVLQAKEKMVNGELSVPDPAVREVGIDLGEQRIQCPLCGHIEGNYFPYLSMSCCHCEASLYNPYAEGVVSWRVESPFLHPRYYELKYIPPLGFLLCRFEGKLRRENHIWPTFEGIVRFAKEQYGIPEEIWKKQKTEVKDPAIPKKPEKGAVDSWILDIHFLKEIQIEVERYLSKKIDLSAFIVRLDGLLRRLTNEECRYGLKTCYLNIEYKQILAVDRRLNPDKYFVFLGQKKEKELSSLIDDLSITIENKIRLLGGLENQALFVADPTIKNWAQDLGKSCLMCPLCEKAWKNRPKTPMVRCPRCHQRLHNPQPRNMYTFNASLI